MVSAIKKPDVELNEQCWLKNGLSLFKFRAWSVGALCQSAAASKLSHSLVHLVRATRNRYTQFDV